MKQKIIASLKTKYQRFGLSNEAIDRIASAKEKTVTSEEEIESAIADAQTMELIANELQKSADVERRNRSNLQKSFDEYKEKHPETTVAPTQAPPTTAPAETEGEKKLREMVENLTKRLDAAEKEKSQATTLAKIKERLEKEGCNNKGILNSTLKGFALGEGETEDAAVERLKGDYNSSYTDTFGNGPVPPRSDPGNGDPKAAAKVKNDWLREQGLLPKEETK